MKLASRTWLWPHADFVVVVGLVVVSTAALVFFTLGSPDRGAAGSGTDRGDVNRRTTTATTQAKAHVPTRSRTDAQDASEQRDSVAPRIAESSSNESEDTACDFELSASEWVDRFPSSLMNAGWGGRNLMRVYAEFPRSESSSTAPRSDWHMTDVRRRVATEVTSELRFLACAPGVPEPGQSVELLNKNLKPVRSASLFDNVEQLPASVGVFAGLAIPLRLYRDGDAIFAERDATDRTRRIIIGVPSSVDPFVNMVSGPRHAVEQWASYQGFNTQRVEWIDAYFVTGGGISTFPFLPGVRAYSWGPKWILSPPDSLPHREGYRLYDLHVRDGDYLAYIHSQVFIPIGLGTTIVWLDEFIGNPIDVQLEFEAQAQHIISEIDRRNGANWRIQPSWVGRDPIARAPFLITRGDDGRMTLRGHEEMLRAWQTTAPHWELHGTMIDGARMRPRWDGDLSRRDRMTFFFRVAKISPQYWRLTRMELDWSRDRPPPEEYRKNNFIGTFLLFQFPLDWDPQEEITVHDLSWLRDTSTRQESGHILGAIDPNTRTSLMYVNGRPGATISFGIFDRQNLNEAKYAFEVSMPMDSYLGQYKWVPISLD